MDALHVLSVRSFVLCFLNFTWYTFISLIAVLGIDLHRADTWVNRDSGHGSIEFFSTFLISTFPISNFFLPVFCTTRGEVVHKHLTFNLPNPYKDLQKNQGSHMNYHADFYHFQSDYEMLKKHSSQHINPYFTLFSLI